MNRRIFFRMGVTLLVAFHVVVLFAGFFAPHGFSVQNRDVPFAPPTRIHFTDVRGRFHLRPFVYAASGPGVARGEEQQGINARIPIRFFVRDHHTGIPGFAPSMRLFGVDEPAQIFLFGTDGFGRDQFSRFLYGGQISILAGWLAAGLSLGFGAVVGSLSGFYGKVLDRVLVKIGELFLALPWLYLLFAVRAFLPLQVHPAQAFLLVVAIIGLVGWARPARLVRGVVLSAKERNYVLAARGFGASDFYLLRRHILPQVSGVLLTQAALLVPQYILAEVTLSFLGLGVGEPAPSWGNMLASLQEYHVLASYWWMYLPAAGLVPLFLGYQLLADAFHERTRLAVV
jgi:peptide/nickel transport system permease protein